MNDPNLEKLAAVSSIIAQRVDRSLNELLTACMEDLAVQPEFAGLEAEERKSVTASIAAATVISILLRQLQLGGCPDNVRQQIVEKAVALETRDRQS